MKLKLLMILAFVATITLHAQVPQIPLIEHFTQASCGPCASQNPLLKTTLDNFGIPNYVRVSHQTSWPGVDPMNAAFPAGPNDRRNYYAINAVPNTVLNGGAPGAPNTIVTSTTLAAAANNMTPYDITATQVWPNANSVTVNIDVANVTAAAISGADRIYVSMVETDVTYPSAPGSNGEMAFEYVMREMYNASTGASGATTGAALGSIAANSTTNFNFTINLPAYIRDKGEVTFAVYLQNNATKQVFQAAKTTAVVIPGVLSASAISTTVVDQGLCDYNMTPGVQVTNNDATAAVTNVVAQYTVDGGTPVQQTFTGNLTSGQSATITFPSIVLNGGTSVVATEILSINGGQNWISPAAVTIEEAAYSKLSTTTSPAPLFEGMEASVLPTGSGYTRDIPTGIFEADAAVILPLFSIVDGPTFSVASPLGGFAASNRSIFVRFFNIPNGQVMNFTMNKLNLGTSSNLTFSHAYRQYQGENDALSVQISTDCGASWTSVFNAAGTTLSTLTPSTASFVPNAASQWRSNTIDLSAFDNMNDVIVRFQATSGFGNNLFIDDIDITSTLSTGDVASLNSVKLYPNPSTDFIQLSGLIDGAQNYTIYNILGAQVMDGIINENDKIDVKSFQDGIYILKLENGNNFKFIKE